MKPPSASPLRFRRHQTISGKSPFLLALASVGLQVLSAATTPERGVAAWGNAAICFEANHGQAGTEARFIARGPAYYFALSPTAATVSLRKFQSASADATAHQGRASAGRPVDFRSLRLEFVGADPEAEVAGEDELRGRVNYFLGDDPANWRTEVPLFARVRVRAMYPGINLVHYGNQQHLEYDFEVAPGADPQRIAIRVKGADRIALTEQGDLVLHLGDDEIRQPKPVIYQTIEGRRRAISGGYVLADARTVKFAVGEYDDRLPLVIDPVLSYSTYYGGTGKDSAWGVAVGADGSVYVAGESMAGLPTTAGTSTNRYHGGTSGHGDAFVAKFDNSASNVIYLSYLGGAVDDVALGLAVDAQGNAYVTGYTDSPDFPRTNALFGSISGTPYPIVNIYPTDAFVAKLGPLGTNLVYSTFLGGNGVDSGVGIATDPAGNAYVAGYTQSTNFPTVNAQGSFTNYSGGYQINDDAFVTKLGPAGTNLVYSMFLGGTNLDRANDVAADAAGFAYVTGYTLSTNFPVTANAFQPWLAGAADAFVTVVAPGGGNPTTSTYLGGVGTNEAYRLTLDADSNIYVTGMTLGDSAFPITASAINPGGAFRSVNAAATWSPVNQGLQSIVVASLAVDPANPSRVYAGTARGIARSLDGGVTWDPAIAVAPMPRLFNLGPTIAIGLVLSIAIDPSDPDTIYAGTGQGVFKSRDGGVSWFLNNTNLNTSSTRALVLDPATPTTLYSGGEFGVYRSLDGATNWQTVNNGLGNQLVRALAISPATPATIYAATAGGVYRSMDRGSNWLAFSSGLANLSAQALTIHPAQPNTLYVGTAAGVFTSTNAGTNWISVSTGLSTSNVAALVVNPLTPATLYAGTTNGLFKSTDAGQHWTLQSATGFTVTDILSLAVIPQSPDTVFAGTRGVNFYGGTDVFVTRLGANGFSTVFGGAGDEEGWDVAVAASGRIFVLGSTASTDFPTRNTSGLISASNAGGRDVFLTQLTPDGGALLSSALLGGSADDWGNGVAVDSSGDAYLVGGTYSGNFPVWNALQTTYRGSFDAFLVKVSDVTLNPVLGIQPAGNQVRLFWSAVAADYHLQSTTNLVTGSSWLPVGGAPVESNGVLSLSVPATNAAQFFRLSNP